MRQGDFKLIEFFDTKAVELYNLRQDLGESHDLASKLASRRNHLLSLLRRWWQTLPAQQQV